MKNVPSENILKLRELTEQICNREESEYDYKKVIKQLKKIVEQGVIEIDNSPSPKSKMKCYEGMCTTIKTILSSIKIL